MSLRYLWQSQPAVERWKGNEVKTKQHVLHVVCHPHKLCAKINTLKNFLHKAHKCIKIFRREVVCFLLFTSVSVHFFFFKSILRTQPVTSVWNCLMYQRPFQVLVTGARVYLHPLYACKSTDVSRWTSFPTTKLIKETVTSTKWCGGFFLTCNDFGRMFDHSFTACAFLFLFFWSGDYLAHANSSLYARISPQWLTGPRRTPPYPEDYYTKRHYTEVILMMMMMMMMILYIPKSIKELCEWCTCLPFVSQAGQAQRFVSASRKEERSTQAGWWGLAPRDPKPSSAHIGSHRPCQSLPDQSKTAARPLK